MVGQGGTRAGGARVVGTLAARLSARGFLPAREVGDLVVAVAEALAVLHARGAAHGAVHPGGVVLDSAGRPRLAVARAVAGTGGGPTGYAAPESLAGTGATPPADVYALGAVAWVALTGGPPPPAAEDRLPLRLLAPECPDALLVAITAALDPDPARRPTAAELARAVRGPAPARPRHRPRGQERTRPTSPRRAGPGALVAPGAGGVLAALVLALVLVAPTLAGDAPGPSPEVGAPEVGLPAASDPSVLHARVRTLVAQREAALRGGDLAALADVHASGSAGLAADRRVLAGGPVAVRFDVVSVVPVPSDAADGTRQVVDVELVTRPAAGPARRELVRLVLGATRGDRWVLVAVGRR
ncbi:protein kinase domain-containing protein [Aquipuribacter nitratireducens]|uniref:non-specific serine/threonine protein kinase n=1 Tax=Aquipuribacter nitratireducens TaxID=650104 RepID=A0ABW0GN09_9MICO